MGQYHKVVNLTKKEYVYAHKIGVGLKLWEQVGFAGSTADVLFFLLASSSGRGGGDVETEIPDILGRWAGDQVAVLGDYSEPDDIPGIDAKAIYKQCGEDGDGSYTDIADILVPFINEQFDTKLDTTHKGWRNRNGEKLW
jgi:hypothetical protein